MLSDHRSYCVYILDSLSGTFYIGMTGDLYRRIFQHKFHRIEDFTHDHNVERLLYWESFDRAEKAIDRESN
jgi:putative endonuclease